jgi:hypothetical protein
MTSKTITLTGAETRAVYSGGANAWLRNDGTDVIYAAAVPGITAGSDGVVSIPAGQSAPVYGAYGTVYLLGTGSVQLIGSDYSTNPFKTSAQSGGSGADSVARAAITAHAGNTEIHVTAAEKSVWDGLSNPNLLINPDFAINQRGQSTYTGISAYTYTVDRWCIWKYNCDNYGTVTVNDDGSLAVDGTLGADDAILTQTMEYGAVLVGKTVTLSLEVSEINGAISIQQHKNVQSTLNISAPGVHKITFDWDNSSNRIVIDNTNCTHYTVKWIKLELGSAATPFVPPDPATELLKCQRYLYRLTQWGRVRLCEYTANFLRFAIATPVAMRAKPSLINADNLVVRSLNINEELPGFTYEVDSCPGNQILIKANKANHGVTDGTIVASGGDVLFSAEL